MRGSSRRVLTGIAAMALCLVVAAPPAAAGQAVSGQVPTSDTASAYAAARRPGAESRTRPASPVCTAPAKGSYSCVQVNPAGSGTSRVAGRSSTQDIVPYPEWCQFNAIYGTRTQACEIFGIIYTTIEIVNGVPRVTGELSLDAISYTYSSASLSNWGHQIGVYSWAGWGAALGARVSGSARGSGSCVPSGSSFPSQPATPFLTLRNGESYFTTTATAVGAIGFCETTWDLVFTTAGYPPAGLSTSLNEIRCDNATGANGFRPRRVGCVVPWYASPAFYSQSSYPSLASHVARAQASGLPGNSFAAPLTRTTNQATIDTNRSRACGDAPSLPGLSCDEYPLASSNQGLAAGGTRRTFDGCNINAPRATGPTGASACMITASENSAQGAIMAAFNYDERVLNGDPFRVLVSA